MRALPGDMGMTTVIMPPARLMVQGALACGDEAVPVQQEVVSRRAASEVAFLQSLDQAKWGSALLVDAAPVGLARSVIAVSQGMTILSWAFVLQKIDERSTRLITRARWGSSLPTSLHVMNYILQPGYFIMYRKMLLGIKERAERTSPIEQAVEERA